VELQAKNSDDQPSLEEEEYGQKALIEDYQVLQGFKKKEKGKSFLFIEK
jgi:hypothetical protein